ncbi:hypothetical protein D3C72_1874940 [compost metagenome]
MSQIVWRDLVDVIIEPVGKQQITVAAPGCSGRVLRIVFREIIVRHFRAQACFNIAEKLACQRMGIVFRMTRDKGNTLVPAGKEISIAIFRLGQDFQIGVIANERGREISIARVRCQEKVIKTARQQRVGMQNMVFVDARQLV